MFILLGLVLLVAWVLGFIVFHVSSFLIDLLVIAAVVSFVAHLVTAR